MNRIDPDVTDLVFRALFSTIFLGLGLEHLFSDAVIQGLMPAWLGALHLKRAVSILCGVVLLTGGLGVLVGYHVQGAAVMLGVFLLLVTAVVHLPGLFATPEGLPDNWSWLWEVFQRSNFVKNLVLFGVCVQLITHETGRFSLEARFRSRRADLSGGEAGPPIGGSPGD